MHLLPSQCLLWCMSHMQSEVCHSFPVCWQILPRCSSHPCNLTGKVITWLCRLVIVWFLEEIVLFASSTSAFVLFITVLLTPGTTRKQVIAIPIAIPITMLMIVPTANCPSDILAGWLSHCHSDRKWVHHSSASCSDSALLRLHWLLSDSAVSQYYWHQFFRHSAVISSQDHSVLPEYIKAPEADVHSPALDSATILFSTEWLQDHGCSACSKAMPDCISWIVWLTESSLTWFFCTSSKYLLARLSFGW